MSDPCAELAVGAWPLALIGLVVACLIVIAVAVLWSDVTAGAVGGGRQTLARARKILVVATDAETEAEGRSWAERQRPEHPDLECLVVRVTPDDVYSRVHAMVDAERPDAVVMVRHREEQHGHSLEGAYGALKEDLGTPLDSIYVEPARR